MNESQGATPATPAAAATPAQAPAAPARGRIAAADVPDTPMAESTARAPAKEANPIASLDASMMQSVMAGLAAQVGAGRAAGPRLADILAPEKVESLLTQSGECIRALHQFQWGGGTRACC